MLGHLSTPRLIYLQILKQHFDSVREAANCILYDPYSPEFWLQRAIHLLYSGFPELAVGDARKSSLLCKAMLSDDPPFFGGIAKLQIGAFPKIESSEQASPAGSAAFKVTCFQNISLLKRACLDRST